MTDQERQTTAHFITLFGVWDVSLDGTPYQVYRAEWGSVGRLPDDTIFILPIRTVENIDQELLDLLRRLS